MLSYRATLVYVVMVAVSVVIPLSLGTSVHGHNRLSQVSGDSVRTSWTGGKTVTEQYQLQWRYETQSEEIIFEIRARALGYVGLGITDTGSMRDADIFFAWVKDGKPFLLDCHGPLGSNGAPVVDDVNNLHLISGEESDGVTTITFKRKLRTCDPNAGQDIDIDSNTVRMMFAFSDQDPDTDTFLSVPYSLQHDRSHRGHFNTYLLANNPPTPHLEQDVRTLELRLNNITVPARETTYWCDVFKIDRAADLNGQKHHIIMSHVIIGGHKEVNAPYIHHLVVHRCNRFPEGWSFSQERPNGGLCYDGGSKLAMMCTSDEMIAAWAVGGEEFYYPPDVGLPLGESEIEYILVEMHYDNPNMEAGIVDDSGVTFLLTPTLRTHDAGTIVTGVAAHFHMFIPPGVADFTVEGTCHTNCTQTSLPESGVTVFAGFLHTHLLGHAVKVRHIRGGVELPYILQDAKYDFNYQDIIRLPEDVQLLPGDAIQTECIYDSTDKDVVTWGGLGTRQEMCSSFLFYYPKSPIPLCVSGYPDPWKMGTLLGIYTFYDNPNYGDSLLTEPQGPIVQVDGVNSTWVEYLESYDWDEAVIREVERAGFTEERWYMCSATSFIGMSPPINIISVYAPPTPVPCESSSASRPGAATWMWGAHYFLLPIIMILSVGT